MAAKKTKAAPEPWRNRIVRHDLVDPRALKPHSLNWRKHPAFQQDALRGVLREVGLVQDVIVTENGTILDGHLRVELALQDGQAEIPVKYVDLSEDEASLVLATMDPITAMAETSASQLSTLLQSVQTDSEAISDLLKNIAPPYIPPGASLPPLDIPSDIANGNGRYAEAESQDDSGPENEDEEFSPPPRLEESHVRMVSLFLNKDTHPVFIHNCTRLQEYFGTDNLTDTVFEAIAHAYRHCQ